MISSIWVICSSPPFILIRGERKQPPLSFYDTIIANIIYLVKYNIAQIYLYKFGYYVN